MASLFAAPWEFFLMEALYAFSAPSSRPPYFPISYPSSLNRGLFNVLSNMSSSFIFSLVDIDCCSWCKLPLPFESRESSRRAASSYRDGALSGNILRLRFFTGRNADFIFHSSLLSCGVEICDGFGGAPSFSFCSSTFPPSPISDD